MLKGLIAFSPLLLQLFGSKETISDQECAVLSVIRYQHQLCFLANHHRIERRLSEGRTAGVSRKEHFPRQKSVLCQLSDRLNNIETVRSVPLERCHQEAVFTTLSPWCSHVPSCWLCQKKKRSVSVSKACGRNVLQVACFPICQLSAKLYVHKMQFSSLWGSLGPLAQFSFKGDGGREDGGESPTVLTLLPKTKAWDVLTFSLNTRKPNL